MCVLSIAGPSKWQTHDEIIPSSWFISVDTALVTRWIFPVPVLWTPLLSVQHRRAHSCWPVEPGEVTRQFISKHSFCPHAHLTWAQRSVNVTLKSVFEPCCVTLICTVCTCITQVMTLLVLFSGQSNKSKLCAVEWRKQGRKIIINIYGAVLKWRHQRCVWRVEAGVPLWAPPWR